MMALTPPPSPTQIDVPAKEVTQKAVNFESKGESLLSKLYGRSYYNRCFEN